ncbi:hypothetical protein [Allosphingosinicella vermicomposti]|uniref:hypothetical protein n=1 Tax=Allosphingosinicella vermicomposti TaxID=614671 RepID=UPI000D1033AB|nr:hypothetical protein [Allosphingosinicella vermicomposti]
MRFVTISAAIAALAVSGCSAGEDDVNAAVELGNGTVSVSAPGFDLAADLPGNETHKVEITTDSEALYPGAKATGLTMSRDQATGTPRFNIGFAAKDDIDTVAKWYGDPRRSGNFKVTGINITNGVHSMSVVDDTGEPFNLILKPGEDGGTTGTLRFRDRGQ